MRVSTAAAATLLGVIHAVSFGPWPAWWLQSITLAALIVLAWQQRADSGWRTSASIGWLFGLGWFTAGLCWMYISMHDYGGMPAPMAALAVVLLAGYLSLFPAAVFAATGVAIGPAGSTVAVSAIGTAAGVAAESGIGSSKRRGRIIAIAAVFSAGWTFAEWLRGQLFTGFPWLATGYAHVDGPLAGFAPVLGVYGVSGFAALVAFGLALLWIKLRSRARPWLAVMLLALPLALGQGLTLLDWSVAHGDPITVRLLQGNIPQDLKFAPEQSRRAMQLYAELIDRNQADPADLTVLPETAWTVPWSATPPEVVAAIFPATEAGRKRAIAVGMPLRIERADGVLIDPFNGGWANSVALIRGDRPAQIATRYDKHHLVPFGEFIPFGFDWFVRMMQIPLGNFARGGLDQRPFEVAGQRIAFNICYEDLFAEELIEALRPGRDASILVNVSNIAWFGNSHALPQHLAISRMRAIETARPMLRSTNTGMTAAIDHHGRVQQVLPAYSVGALQVRVQGTRGLTPYARFGNAAALGLAGVGLVLALWALRRRAGQSPAVSR